jgi:hypothetical protein
MLSDPAHHRYTELYRAQAKKDELQDVGHIKKAEHHKLELGLK